MFRYVFFFFFISLNIPDKESERCHPGITVEFEIIKLADTMADKYIDFI